MVIKDVFHFNVNCTNFDRSLAFYELVGFEVVHHGTVGPAAYRRALGLSPDATNRSALLMLEPHKPRSTRLDLIEWIEPAAHGEPTHRPPTADLTRNGIARIAMWAIGMDEEYLRLSDAGVEFITEPVLMSPEVRFCCFYDPDGVVLELIEFVKH